MRSRIGVAVSFVLLSIVLAAPLAAADRSQVSRVKVVPADGYYAVGREIDVEVWIEDVSDLYGADIQLEFDAQRLSVVDANPGWPGVQVQPLYDWFWPDLIVRNAVTYTLNTTGTVWYAATQLYPRPPVGGTGALLSFKAQALASGDAWIRFKKWQLASSDAMPIEAAAVGATYHIGQPRQLLLPLVVAGP